MKRIRTWAIPDDFWALVEPLLPASRRDPRNRAGENPVAAASPPTVTGSIFGCRVCPAHGHPIDCRRMPSKTIECHPTIA